MLRRVLGDAGFFGLLQSWYVGHKDGVGNTAQYQAAAEIPYGSSLDWFFEEWVYGLNMPTYQFGWKTANLGGGAYRTYLRVLQVQTNAGTFTMPIDLTLVSASGSQVRTVWNDAADQDFVLDTTEPITSIVFDPAGWILKTGVTSVALADADADGVPDRNDNCPSASNPGQQDFDVDTAGDACDADDDNDLLDDPQDCAPLDPTQGRPGEVAVLSVNATGAGAAELSWTAAIRADTYDISRGTIAGLSTGYGSCLETGWSALTLVDPDVPAEGEGFQYLVRGVDSGCGGAGPAGFDSSGTPRFMPCP